LKRLHDTGGGFGLRSLTPSNVYVAGYMPGWAHTEFVRRLCFQASEVDMGRFRRARSSTVRQLLSRLARGQRRTVWNGQLTDGRPPDETAAQALFQPP